ncbi:MAG: 30S ribosomal protein S14 [Ottowia sp.]|nr:30S ribosomal protein S14 [Ottowia sp.]
MPFIASQVPPGANTCRDDTQKSAKLENAREVTTSKLPRNSSKIRLRNRCSISGRSRAYIRKFGLSRITFRELALDGKIPGVTKASW